MRATYFKSDLGDFRDILNVLSWRNLTLDTWFRISNEKNEMNDGELVKILTLAQVCKVCKVWSTSIFAAEIDR